MKSKCRSVIGKSILADRFMELFEDIRLLMLMDQKNFSCVERRNSIDTGTTNICCMPLFYSQLKISSQTYCKFLELNWNKPSSKARFTHRKIFLGQTIFLCLVSSHAQLMGSRQKKFSCPKKIFLCLNGP